MAELNFNGAGQEAMDDFSVVPADTYNVQIVKSEVVQTKDKTGTLLKTQFKIIDGKFKGRIIFGQYNLTNQNPQAVEISRKQMKTLCDAIGKPDGVKDSNELHNIPLQIKVSIKPAKGIYAEQNEIKFYSKYKGPTTEGASSEGEASPSNPAGDASGGSSGGSADSTEPKKAPWNT
jgi:hypothetical protein